MTPLRVLLACVGLLLAARFVLAEEPIPPREVPTPAGHPYYPLQVGAEWTYKVAGASIQVKVVGTEKLPGGVVGYKLQTSAQNKVTATEIVGVDESGVKRFKVNDLAPDAPILFLPADPKKTREWEVDTRVGGQAIQGKFRVTREKVTVPAGTYEAVHVEGADMMVGNRKTTVGYWFARDVGIVKLRFTLGTQDATLELEKHTPGKRPSE